LSGHTFTGHTAACAAAVAVQTIIERDGLLDHVRLAGPRFMQMLAAALDGIAAVGDIRGRGFFVGIEFVADRVSREPFEAKLGIAARIAAAAAGHGLLVYACTGNVDGRRGDTVILSPPYDTPLAKLEEIAALFGRSVRAAVA
jgi:adenosylmethionine-8-amino-7-oxononanoate aminotransferase